MTCIPLSPDLFAVLTFTTTCLAFALGVLWVGFRLTVYRRGS